MPIAVECGKCKARFSAPDNYAGRQTKCPKCGGPISIATAAPTTQAVMLAATPRPPAQPTAESVLAGSSPDLSNRSAAFVVRKTTIAPLRAPSILSPYVLAAATAILVIVAGTSFQLGRSSGRSSIEQVAQPTAESPKEEMRTPVAAAELPSTAIDHPDDPAPSVPPAEGPQSSPDSPEAVVAGYLDAKDWQSRLKFVKQTPGIEKKMADKYAKAGVMAPKYSDITVAAKTGQVSTVTVMLSGERWEYFVEHTANGPKLLWEPSTGWQPIGWEPFRASRSIEPTELFLACKMSSSYFHTHEKGIKHTHYSVNVLPVGFSNPSMMAFVVKASPAGQRIFEVLKDGQQHVMVLAVQFRPKIDEDCLWITKVCSDQPFIYDEAMQRQLTSPIVVDSEAVAKDADVPFDFTNVTARWIVSHDVLGGKSLMVPEVRLKIKAKAEPISKLKIKAVFLETKPGETEILDEKTSYVVGSGDRSLEKTLSKEVILHSGTGYKTAAGEGLIEQKQITVDLYYDTGDDFVKFHTRAVESRLVD